MITQLSYLFTPLHRLVAGEKRRKISHGVALMYKDRLPLGNVRRIADKTLDNNVYSAVEHLVYAKFNKDYCNKNIKYKGLIFLDQALEAGRGVVLLHGHMGNPHMIMPAIGHMGYTLHQIASRNPPETHKGFLSNVVNSLNYKCFERINFLREQLPVNFIYTDKFLRAPFKALKRNEIVAIALDGREGKESVELDFLNQKAIFYTGTMRMILMAKPVVLPVFHIRNEPNEHTIVIEKPFEVGSWGERTIDIKKNTECFLKILEKYIYQYPWLYADAFVIKDPFFLKHDS